MVVVRKLAIPWMRALFTPQYNATIDESVGSQYSLEWRQTYL